MNEVPYPTPPRWAERLLSWLVRDAWATPQGDFEEVFHEIGATRGYGAARRWYAWQVIRLLPGRSYENTYWFMVMIRSYFQIAVRSLLKNRVATVINVAGLAITIGCSMVAFLFIHSTLVRDGFHEHADQIFLIEHLRAEDGTMQVYGTSPLPLGPLLNTDVADVELAVRKKEAWVQVKRGPEALGDLISFVDPTFLDLFTFPLQAGRREALHDDRYIILSDNAAHRYFGDQEAVGKPLVLTFNGQEQTFTVGGVAHPFPDNAGLQFNALVDIEALRRLYPPALDDWTNLGATFVKMPPDRAAALPAQLETYHARFQAEAEAYTVGGFAVDRLTDLTLRAEHIRDSIIGGVPWPPIVVLSIISVFLLTLSCINFINIALGTSMKRRREIGVRKVMGSTRGQLVWQFLAE
ncbi:MAG: ABC transporter permease, partial [Bacteroidota bacterium]